MQEFLQECENIDYSHKSIQVLAKALKEKSSCKNELIKNCFLYVRDEIKHLGDYPADIKSCKASEVLENKRGLCYAKSHLLAALLRFNKIPTALVYQRLSCSEYIDDIYCLHGLNAVYLEEEKLWYRIDARGNKEGVNAQFTPPIEKLAFELKEAKEFDINKLYIRPLKIVVEYLNKYDKFEDLKNNLPDIKSLDERVL